MKKFFAIFIILLLVSCFGCAKKEEPSQSVSADEQKTAEPEMPFKDITADGIGEIFFAITRGGIDYECTKSYTDADAISKTVEFLSKATVSSENKYENNNVGNNPPYVIEIRDAQGGTVYSISFTNKFEDGYYCYLKDISNGEKDEFFVDSEYMYPLIEHIASLDGKTPEWTYSRPFENVLERDSISEVKIEYNGKTTRYTDLENITRCTQQFRFFACIDSTEKWNDEIQKTCVVSFFDKDGSLVCKFETNGYTVGDNFQLRFNDETLYFANKTQFGFFEEFMI